MPGTLAPTGRRRAGAFAVLLAAAALGAAGTAWNSATGSSSSPGPPVPGAPDTAGIALPADTCRGMFLVAATLAPRDEAPAADEARTLSLLLDTGSASSWVDPQALARASGRRLPAGTRVAIAGVLAGAHRFDRLRARVQPLGHLARALGRPVDGILGFDAFAGVLLTLDYPARQVRIARGALPPPDGIKILPYRGDGRPFVSLEVAGRRRTILLDSGSAGTLSITDARGTAWLTPPRVVKAVVRLDGIARRPVGRLDDTVSLAGLDFVDPIAEVVPRGSAQLVGSGMLSHYALTFDQANRRVRLLTTAEGPLRMDGVTGSGAVFRPRPEGLEIADVAGGSPAATAGLRAGDLVLAVGGLPAAARGCDRPSAGDAGSIVHYRVRRHGAEMCVWVRHDVLVR